MGDEIINKSILKGGNVMEIDPFIFRLSIFILYQFFVGYYVVWSVTPSLHLLLCL